MREPDRIHRDSEYFIRTIRTRRMTDAVQTFEPRIATVFSRMSWLVRSRCCSAQPIRSVQIVLVMREAPHTDGRAKR